MDSEPVAEDESVTAPIEESKEDEVVEGEMPSENSEVVDTPKPIIDDSPPPSTEETPEQTQSEGATTPAVS